jgi:hypothetical protein
MLEQFFCFACYHVDAICRQILQNYFPPVTNVRCVGMFVKTVVGSLLPGQCDIRI